MNLKEIESRFKKLYTPAISDALDQLGYWNQILPHGITPLKQGMKIAGPAFTMLGVPSRETDKTKRLAPRALDAMTPGVVAVMATSGDERTGHWGELMTNASIHRGCVGAVVDGGIRDTWNLVRLDFPIFHTFRSPGDALGRFNIIEYQTDIVIGDVKIHPGDYLFGDDDGIVVIPQEHIMNVLLEAESIVETENEIRERVRKGEPIADLYLQYDQF